MFGIGGSEIIVILIVALLFLGPDKLPEAAKTISKGIRDLKKQSRTLQQTIENDERIGGAIRDIKSALRGEDPPPRPKPYKPPKQLEAGEDNTIKPPEADAKPESEPAPAVTLPATAGEPDPEVKEADSEELAKMIRPATGTVAKDDQPAERKHG